jgi:hypothetical protein
LTPNERQPTLTEEQAAPHQTPANGRTANGRFAKNNSGGPGNPHARHCARMLALFRDAISDDEMNQLFRMLIVKAMGGDTAAAKLILSYKIGKLLDAPHPDSIDRDEWDHYQGVTANPASMVDWVIKHTWGSVHNSRSVFDCCGALPVPV